MTDHPAVSIILTFHNSKPLVEHAIGLVVAQTYRDFELIVVDDGSTDGTASALTECVASLDYAELIAKQSNEGVAAARNTAVAAARGEFVWFLDCDDWWDPRTLEKLIAAARQENADITVCRAVRSREVADAKRFPLDGSIRSESVDRAGAIEMLVSGHIRGYLWNKLISTRLLRENPFPRMSSLSDITGITAVVAAADKVAFIPDMLYVHLVREGSITNSRSPALRNIETSWSAIRSLAISSGVHSEGDAPLTYFDYRHYYAAVLNTFHRVGSDDPEALRYAIDVRRSMTWRGSLVVARYDKRLGVITLLMRYTGPAYGAIYGAFRSLFRR
jgi:glycosyltransferase involved in cell wall biosynthesis